MRVPALIATILTAMSAVSCGWRQLGKPQDEVQTPFPEAWSQAAEGQQDQVATGWLAAFNSEELTQSVNRALARNHDLQIAAARMREARSNPIIARARQLPAIDLSATSSVTDPVDAPSTDSYGLNLSASWEVDLWGRLQNLKSAAYADARAALDDYRSARLSLAASTAKAWCDLISADQQVTLARATLKSFETNLRIIERNYKGTGEGALDIQFGRNNVSSAKRALESRLLARQETARSLELLLGDYPDGLTDPGNRLPSVSEYVPAGLPSELLDRRPDLTAAKARLLASAREADAARKSLLPAFSLTGGYSTTSGEFNNLLDVDQLVASIAGRLVQPVFRGGSLRAQARAALERNKVEIHRYARTVLNAFREVESALAADRSLARQETFLASELEQANLAEQQAERNYTEGINPNILSVLEAQRRANNARASMIRLRNERLQNRIDLHLALGGDFDTRPQDALKSKKY